MGAINFSGLVSGLDTRAVVDAILNFERQPINRLEDRRELFSQRNAALEKLRSGLNAFESALRDLSSPTTFRGRTSSVSDESALRATAGAGAETGLFQLDITTLATAQKVKSDGIAAPDQGLVSDGTITIQSGSNNVIQIDVAAGSGNNSLEAVRDAINAADAGVQSSILFDGTDYRLTVRSEETGAANALTITDGTNLNLDVVGNEVSAAGDAAFTVDGIDITSSSNKVTTVIPGVTIDLLAETAGTPVTLEVLQDNDAVVEGVQDLVAKYNELTSFFNEQFDPANPGPLAGDSTARQIQSRVQSLFTRGVDGIPFGSIRSLSAVGISFDGKTGEASLDSAELRELLETRFDEVGDLFLSSTSASDFRVRFAGSTGSTESGDYAVTISQAAEQASVIGNKAINGSINADETLSISIGNDSVDVLLTNGSNITEVVDTINSALTAAGIRATASDDSGSLRISSRDYGSNVQIDVVSDRNAPPNGKSSGIGTTVLNDTGEDVVGTIGGVAATGSGQVLSGGDGEAFEGLSLLIAATAADVTATGGDFGTVSFSRGLIDSIVADVDLFTRIGDGILETSTESIDRRIDQLNDDIERLEDKLSVRESQLLRQFAAAEQAISALQAQQGSLGSFRVL